MLPWQRPHGCLREAAETQDIVIDVIKGDEVVQYSGVLKDYTAEFLEILDVDYRITDNQSDQHADVVVSRKYGVVRHLGE